MMESDRKGLSHLKCPLSRDLNKEVKEAMERDKEHPS
jgi:hypothetical protein